ncbi:hypothetical protein GH714_036383 [Hevea brasiliensis]|uniref:TORTIFOLIA1/SINE1-2 N-terminal domain-containing protein n=1 Tax=Hevea brasiliensis TaxID=3981 RepID=A0A6A6LQW6_HEVBR|nr:hypothetical protein GH714_036383 [Hevea brasiliensis]
MSPEKRSPPTPASTANDLKHRVITCLNKLSDRATLSLATTELESIAKNLNHDSFFPFLNCIHNTDSSSKSPVRKQCVNLLTLLSNSHGNSLSPHLSKMISTVTRRLRDPDSAVRSACVEATSAMSSQITKPPFSTLSKPFIELLTLEQDFNAQVGASMCLAAAIEAAPEPEAEHLRRVLPRLGKLVKGEGFRAKAALLTVIGISLALAALRVKAVRETMNRTLELWKEVPGVSDQVSVSSQSKSSPVDNAIGECFPSDSDDSHEVGFKSPQPKKTVPANRSPQFDSSSVTTTRKQNPVKSKNDNSKTAMSCKMDHKKTSAWKTEIVLSHDAGCGDDIKRCSYGVSESREDPNNEKFRPEAKLVLCSRIREDKQHKLGGLRSRSRVVPFNDDDNRYNKDVEVNNPNEEFFENNKDIEDLSLICDQLMQIENQQTNLLILLQRFIGSSQHGINSLQTRVLGLEMALDEISYDLALSSGRIPNTDSADNTCCKPPGAEFLSSKFWRRTEGRYSTSRFSSSGSMQSPHAARNIYGKDASSETFNANSQRFQHQNRSGFILNPLPNVRSVGKRNLGFYSSQMSNNIIQEDGQAQKANLAQ